MFSQVFIGSHTCSLLQVFRSWASLGQRLAEHRAEAQGSEALHQGRLQKRCLRAWRWRLKMAKTELRKAKDVLLAGLLGWRSLAQHGKQCRTALSLMRSYGPFCLNHLKS